MSEVNTGQVHEELLNIRYLLEVLASDKLRALLEEVLTTPDRQKVWGLCTGLLSTKEIAERTELSTRAVQIIVKELTERDLVSVPRRGYPKRRFDYVPSHWKVIT
jgi:transcription initiation factor IIE alpha subunit